MGGMSDGTIIGWRLWFKHRERVGTFRTSGSGGIWVAPWSNVRPD